MGDLVSRAALTDRLIRQLAGEHPERPMAGDFACVCTDRARDTWEILPIALVMTDGTVLQLRDQAGGLIALSSLAERDETIVMAQRLFPDLEAVRALCWLPFDGLAALRIRAARLRRADA